MSSTRTRRGRIPRVGAHMRGLDVAHTFAERFSKALDRWGGSPAQLAAALGIDRSVVSKWKQGSTAPRASRLIAMCVVLDVSADWLLGLSDQIQPDAARRMISRLRKLQKVIDQTIEDLEEVSDGVA